MNESEAVDALEHLGLTGYEAQVFIALQKLGTGSASDVDRVADVPRSQVYGVAESLEERGLVEVQQSNPITYRPVTLAEARDRLVRRFEREQDRAFEFLESVQRERRDGDEHREDVWTVHGRDSVDARVERLLADAGASVTYGVGADLFDEGVVETLADRAAAGVAVTVVSADETVLDHCRGVSGVVAIPFPEELVPEDRERGRILVVDGDTVLLSVLGAEEVPGVRTETAIWSTETAFAAVFVRMFETWFDQHATR